MATIIQQQFFSIKKPFHNDKNYAQQKDNDRNPVDAVHHFDIDIAWPRRILLSEKIPSHFTQREELL